MRTRCIGSDRTARVRACIPLRRPHLHTGWPCWSTRRNLCPNPQFPFAVSIPPPISTGAQLSPATSIGRHIRWQVLLALAGVLILTTMLGYTAYNVATVMVPAEGGVFRVVTSRKSTMTSARCSTAASHAQTKMGALCPTWPNRG